MAYQQKKSEFKNTKGFKKQHSYDNKKPNTYSKGVAKNEVKEEEDLNLMYLKRCCFILDKFIKDNKTKPKADSITVYVFKDLYNSQYKSDSHNYDDDLKKIFNIVNVLINMTKGILNKKINPRIITIRQLYFFNMFDVNFPYKAHDFAIRESFGKSYPDLFKSEFGVKFFKPKDKKDSIILHNIISFVKINKDKKRKYKKPTNNTNTKRK